MKKRKTKNQKIYDKLRKTMTVEEIADAFIFPSELSPEEEEKSRAELSKFIKERREKMSFMTKLRINYLSIKYKIQNFFNR